MTSGTGVAGARAGDVLWACGCGEENIPGFLARAGLFGTAFLVIGLLSVMALVAAALGGVLWLAGLRRRREEARRARPVPPDEVAETEAGRLLDGFGWWEGEPP
ncbi:MULTISPECIES: hypothetical protein [unclassified Streptomyces]|uniref:hypothetical protein n=1 Tax=unclassified Streptomyces TaxID=2593676 RepID=UPI003D719F11